MCAILSHSKGNEHMKQWRIVQSFWSSKKWVSSSVSPPHHGTQAGRPLVHRSGGGGATFKAVAEDQAAHGWQSATDMMRWRELRRACRALTGAWVRHHSQPETWTDDYHHCRRARSARNRGHGPSLTNSEKGNEVVHHGRRQGYCHR